MVVGHVINGTGDCVGMSILGGAVPCMHCMTTVVDASFTL